MTPYQQLVVDFFGLIASLGTPIATTSYGAIVMVIEDIVAMAPPPPPTSVPAAKPGGATIPQAKH